MGFGNQKLDKTLQILKRYHSKIQFTKENESNDLQLIIENDHIITNYYRKFTSSGRIFNSILPTFHMKFNTIFNFAEIIKILNNRKFDKKNVEIITTTLEYNNYPP